MNTTIYYKISLFDNMGGEKLFADFWAPEDAKSAMSTLIEVLEDSECTEAADVQLEEVVAIASDSDVEDTSRLFEVLEKNTTKELLETFSLAKCKVINTGKIVGSTSSSGVPLACFSFDQYYFDPFTRFFGPRSVCTIWFDKNKITDDQAKLAKAFGKAGVCSFSEISPRYVDQNVELKFLSKRENVQWKNLEAALGIPSRVFKL